MRTPALSLPVRSVAVAFVAVSGVALAAAQAPPAAPAFAFAEPGISPDGSEIAFVSGGDIWTVPADGGEARLLVADPATDRRPLYSPDGRALAFVSARTGGGDIYVLALDTGRLRRLTWSDGAEQLDAWSPDGRWIYFSSTADDIAGMNDVYRVAATGGTPMVVSGERYTNEFSAAPGPDDRVAIVARGISSSQWWRKGSSHIDTSEIWVVDPEARDTPEYARVLPRDARHAWPMWDARSGRLYVVSDGGGAENLRVIAQPGDPAGPVTTFTDGRVLWPSMSADGRTIAFERDFGIWTVDTAGGEARRVPITRRGAPASQPPERVRQTARFSDLALSPDGLKVAFVAHGDIYAASAKAGGVATRVTDTAGLESQPSWAPDSRRLAFVARRGEGSQIYLHDFGDRTETAVTRGESVDISPVFSPDGRALAFLRDRRELRVVDLESGDERALAAGTLADTVDDPRPVWSPDGAWVALFVVGTRGFTNVELVPVAGGPRRPVSFLSNMYTNRIAWSPDGTYLLFDTRQRTESGELARVDLTLRTPPFREDLFRDLFDTPARPPGAPGEPTERRATPARTTGDPPPAARDAAGGAAADEAKAAPDPVAPVFAGIRQRISLLPIGLDVRDATISPDGKLAVVTAAAAGQTNLYAWSLDALATEPPVARQITSTPGAKGDVQFTPDGREVFYLDAGRIRVATVANRETRGLDVTAEYTVDFETERLVVFRQAWTLLRDHFFDPGMNGVAWDAAHETYLPRVSAAANADELRRLASLMIGELNASHLGISGGGGAAPAIGRLGLAFDRREYESSGRLRIASVVPLGPAALTRDVQEGEYLVAVDGRATGAGVNLDELLADTVDRRVELRVARTAGGDARTVVVRPASQGTAKSLLYRQWVEANRDYVLKASGGRLGYVHMINMSAGALDQLHVDLDTENHARDGVVVDLRNNSGGFVNGYALDVFTRRSYLRMSTRALPEAPARAILGQRALELPTVLVTNQHSLSDAEDFVEGYRSLELGSVVGEPTAGWIIYTWNTTLVDGSTLRLPRMRVKAADGRDMEMAPRPVDLEVSRPLGESAAGKDTQLDAAVRTLLDQLGRAEAPAPAGGGRRRGHRPRR